MDTQADWKNDSIFLPPVSLSKLKPHKPTEGWEVLKNKGKVVKIPTTVEAHYWGNNNSTFGVTGNYVGVSWFYSTIKVDNELKNRRITLQFEGVRMRAEVYINRKLSGYDLVDGTPFEIDITDKVIFGKENEIAVRITDPNGGFDWRDNLHYEWGSKVTMASHGFGGITGDVNLVVTDKTYIDNVFIKNKPNPKEIEVQVNLLNKSWGSLNFTLLKGNQSVLTKTLKVKQLNGLLNTSILFPKANLWSPETPNLYTLQVAWKGDDGSRDVVRERFGFRWFEIRKDNGDSQFFLNGKRVFLLSAISWSFWPVNGITPTKELAIKQIKAAKTLGLNMLNFHRAIGDPRVFDAADSLGLFLYEEPGGYQSNHTQYPIAKDSIASNIDFISQWRREKMFRMIKRDRNHPSLIIYNFHNERSILPNKQDSLDLIDAQKIDPTRIITYDSPHLFPGLKGNPYTPYAQKLHVLPYNAKLQNYGWWDEHHAGGPGSYHDNTYKSPTSFYKHITHKDEIVIWGEEGAIGTPPRLGLIKEEIEKSKLAGWEKDDYLKWYKAYDDFLYENPDFKKFYKNVDTLCRRIGNVAYYYQGRMIENTRIGNISDAYMINGWESMKLENHSGIVDNYRNFKGDVNLIAKYSKPLYIAVKLRNKVVAENSTIKADFFIVNQNVLKGNYRLEITALHQNKSIFNKSVNVKVTGGNKYGELIASDIAISNLKSGYTVVKARLFKGDKILSEGSDEVFAVESAVSSLAALGSVYDSSGVIASFLKSKNIKAGNYTKGKPEGKYLIVGNASPKYVRTQTTDIINWVNEGGSLIIVGKAAEWAQHLADKEVIDYRGSKELGKVWMGGNFFAKPHPLFINLPQTGVFNWEYQCFNTYNKIRIGLQIKSGETIVAAITDHKKEVFSALSVIPLGRGKIIITSLDILSCLNDKNLAAVSNQSLEGENAALESLNEREIVAANVVAEKLLLNMISYTSQSLKEKVASMKGLVALWDFKEDQNQAREAIGASNFPLKEFNGSIPRINEGPLSGFSSKFDGKTYLSLPHSETGELNIHGKDAKVTVIAWVKWTGEQQGFVGGMWNEYQDGGKRQYGLFVSLPYYNGANKVCGHISDTGKPTPPFPYSVDYSASKQEVPANEWKSVAFTYDGNYMKSFMNGVFEPTEPELINNTKGFKGYPDGLIQSKNPYYFPNGMGNLGSDFTVGAVQLKSGMGNNFKGQIAGLAVFNRVLTDEELASLAIN
nr:glycoside hydrolase family 2 [Pedobacter glucosidilyticus]